jgi:hypothetical protein
MTGDKYYNALNQSWELLQSKSMNVRYAAQCSPHLSSWAIIQLLITPKPKAKKTRHDNLLREIRKYWLQIQIKRFIIFSDSGYRIIASIQFAALNIVFFILINRSERI